MSELTSQEIREWRNQHESQFGRSDFIDALCDLALRGLDDAEDAERLASLAWPNTFCDEYGGVDIHEEASVNASAFGREEPNRDDYVAAVRTAIDAARKESQ